jgi:hypothetical protein
MPDYFSSGSCKEVEVYAETFQTNVYRIVIKNHYEEKYSDRYLIYDKEIVNFLKLNLEDYHQTLVNSFGGYVGKDTTYFFNKQTYLMAKEWVDSIIMTLKMNNVV